MESEVVTRCISEKLKEKGFNWVCSHYYRISIKDLFRIFPCEDWSDVRDRINVPTISQALKWLKENVKVFQKEDLGDFILANLRKNMME